MKTCLLFFLLCSLAALRPLWTARAEKPSVGDFPGWQTAPLPGELSVLSPGEREARFAAGFPGKIGVFTDGIRTYVARWVRMPTRKLHPAGDCLRALGYTVSPRPIFAEYGGPKWGTAEARRSRENLQVRERITDAAGRNWTDVSAWYWDAVLGRSVGPWWAVTIIEPAPAPNQTQLQ